MTSPVVSGRKRKEKKMAARRARVSSVNYISHDEARKPTERKAAVVDREVQRLNGKGVVVTPERLLQEASNPRNPLHRYFEWDDSRAAHKWRLEQARQMLMASKFVAQIRDQAGNAQNVTVRKLIPLNRGEGFKMRNDIVSRKDTRDAFIHQRLEALRGWCASVSDLNELKALRELILDNLPV